VSWVGLMCMVRMSVPMVMGVPVPMVVVVMSMSVSVIVIMSVLSMLEQMPSSLSLWVGDRIFII